MIQLAKQGFTECKFEEYDTDWNSKAYFTVSGQNSNNSVRVANGFMEAVEKDGPWHLFWRTEKEKAKKEGRAPKPRRHSSPRSVGPDHLRRLGLRRSRPAVRHHHQRMAHLPRGWAHQCVEPVLRIHVPRRHRLQPGVHQSAQVLRCRDAPLRRRLLPPCHPALDADSRNLRLHGAVPEPVRSRRNRSTTARSASVTPTWARCSWCRASPTIRRKAGPSARAITALMHAASYATVGGDRGGGRAVPALSRPIARPCCASCAIIAGPLTTRRRNEYEGLTITPVGIDPNAIAPIICLHAAREESDRMVATRRKVRLPQRPGDVHRADRDHRPGHGLRHHRRRARFRPRQIQEAGRRRLLQDHQRLDPARPAPARLLRRSRSTTSCSYCQGAGTLEGCPHINRASLKAKGFTDEILQRSRSATARRLRSDVRLQPLDHRRRFPQRTLSFTEEQYRRARLRSARQPSASPGRRSPTPTTTCAAP